MMSHVDVALVPLLEQKIRLLTGATAFTTHASNELGIDSIALSDGPIGIRGIAEPSPVAAQLPNPSAIAATWDADLVARLGSLIGREARRLGIDVVLAPVVNLQRTPVSGRHFEMYSEDPTLTAETMVRFVSAVQAEGVGVCVKHFVGNESETDRTEYVARIPEQALREVYLAPFEAAVKRAHAWSIMAAYNRVDAGGEIAHATEHSFLINDVLKGEWGFDGVVVSDWLATQTTVESALGGLDVVMPGPGGPWEQHLTDAVRDGLVPQDVIDDKIARLRLLASRVRSCASETVHTTTGAYRDEGPASHEVTALLREVVARATVVLRNADRTLPLDPEAVTRIALIGPNAVEPFAQGGGSASVNAPYLVTPAQGLREAFPNAELTVHRGVSARRFAHRIDAGLVTTAAGEPGYELALFDAEGNAVGDATVVTADEGWNRGVPPAATTAVVTAHVTLDTPGAHRLEVGLSGIHTAWFDDELVSASDEFANANVILDSSANHPDGPHRVFDVAAGETRVIQVRVACQVVDADAYGRFVRFELRHDLHEGDPDAELDDALASARAADVAIVIVGTNEEVESEGWDRRSLALPGRQNKLVELVAAANPHTIVVVNAGAPVILPWLDEVPAVLWWWLPGQEAGHGLADALTGTVEPSGRLPWTLPAHEADVPVPNALPVEGIVTYRDGVHVGYRGWDRLGRTPARPFGFGLGYSRWSLDTPIVFGQWDSEADLAVTVALHNDGDHHARGVVQLYLSGPSAADGAWDRPASWFAGYGTADVPAGATGEVTIRIPRRAFHVWSVADHAWILPHGRYTIRAAFDARDDGQSVCITL